MKDAKKHAFKVWDTSYFATYEGLFQYYYETVHAYLLDMEIHQNC